jgi:hypothetical protein
MVPIGTAICDGTSVLAVGRHGELELVSIRDQVRATRLFENSNKLIPVQDSRTSGLLSTTLVSATHNMRDIFHVISTPPLNFSSQPTLCQRLSMCCAVQPHICFTADRNWMRLPLSWHMVCTCRMRKHDGNVRLKWAPNLAASNPDARSF